MGDHRIIYLANEQRSNTHPKEEYGCGHPPQRRAHQRDDLNHLYRTVLPGLCFPLANYFVLFYLFYSKKTSLILLNPPKFYHFITI